MDVKMPRPKTQSDEDVLEAANRLIHAHGPEALTFERLSVALVQRFKSKATLKQRALLQAWDRLDDKTARLSKTIPRTPGGAIGLLVALSQDYGGIESYAEGLLVLREDLRDPLLRARGASWKASLCAVLDACFA
ncbi:MAG: TetR/AcrR family transcriptional regulator, partial [Mesorhizobium sp.]